MTDESRPTVDEVLAQASRQFLVTARGTIGAFEQFAEQLAANPDAEGALAPLRREVHRLHGSAGTFGFARLGRMAAALESAVKKWVADPALDRDRRAPIVAQFAQALRHELAEGGAGAPTFEARRLLIVGFKDAVAVPLTTEAAVRGFTVERVDADELDEAMADGPAHAVIAADTVPGLDALGATPRLVLRRRDAGDKPGGATNGIRTLDMRTNAVEVLDAVDAIADRVRVGAGTALAVDDDPVIRTLVQLACDHMNLHTRAVGDADAFRAALKEVTPALVIVDIEIGSTSGLDLVRELRARGDAPAAPILMLSGHADAATRDAAFDAGADDYMLKPFAPAEFQRRVLGLLDAQRHRLASLDVEPASGLSQPGRTARDFEGELQSRLRAGTAIAVVAPAEPPGDPDAMAHWQRECARLARSARERGGTAGLLDVLTLGVLVPGSDLATLEWLTAESAEAPGDAPPWSGGVVGAAVRGDDASLQVLLASAREARAAARESGVPVRLWDTADADLAPDVIVVEDDVPLADLIVFALETKGLTHRHFADGVAALEGIRRMRVRTGRPIVLLDVDLPGLDGHALHERLLLERPGQFEYVFLSIHGGETDQLRALQAGALDYLAKPVSLRLLIAKLSAWRERTRGA